MREWSARYEYTHANVDKYAPTGVGAGVYRLIYKIMGDPPASPGYNIFYVGQSQDMNKALHEHLNGLPQGELPRPINLQFDPARIKEYLQAYVCYFSFIQVSSAEERNSIEKSPEHDFIPKNDMDFDAWFHNFVTKLNADPAAYDLPPADLAELNASYKKWSAGYDAHLKAQIVLRASEQKLKDAEQKMKDMGLWDWDRNRPKDIPQKLKDALQEGEEWKQ
jgi:hypothetical protein